MGKNHTQILSFVFVFIIACSIFTTSASAVFYEGSFPYAETGLTGGGYIECSSNVGDICIVLPIQYIDKFITFTTGGNLFNVSSNTINCIVFIRGSQYSARFNSFGTLQYRSSSSMYNEYIDITTGEIVDTNVIFATDSERVNENYYFDYYQIAVLSLLVCILFFVFLGWFLWHRK